MARRNGRGGNNRGGGDRTTPRPRARPPEVVEEPPSVPLSDPQEIEFLPAREGRVWAPVEVERSVRDARELLEEGDKDAGRRVWRFGDKLLELYNGFPERAKGFPTFNAFARQTFEISRQDVTEFLRARYRVKNADVATALGRRRISLAFRLLDLLSIETLETLKERDLELPDEQTCRFPATVRQLQAAVTLLEGSTKAKPSRKVAGEAERRNEMVRVAKADDPLLRGLRMKYVPRGGKIFLENGPVSPAQRAAFAKLILRIEEED